MLYVKIKKKNGNTSKTPGNLQLQTKKRSSCRFQIEDDCIDDCLGEHLNRIGILVTNICPICISVIMNSDPLLDCTGLDGVTQEHGDHLRLYWEVRVLMDWLCVDACLPFAPRSLHFYCSLIVL
ncbi:hypothetical protein NPIL_652631 [Nephila pilipes]|uniref:Uncharacterized protein n=1 Tax=Nephila pilipes TaxID=299642 RepID=A0A8X6MVT2_NEPPI|nr:hypothetical protein NPIL_652631 [Nephila pilipes]